MKKTPLLVITFAKKIPYPNHGKWAPIFTQYLRTWDQLSSNLYISLPKYSCISFRLICRKQHPNMFICGHVSANPHCLHSDSDTNRIALKVIKYIPTKLQNKTFRKRLLDHEHNFKLASNRIQPTRIPFPLIIHQPIIPCTSTFLAHPYHGVIGTWGFWQPMDLYIVCTCWLGNLSSVPMTSSMWLADLAACCLIAALDKPRFMNARRPSSQFDIYHQFMRAWMGINRIANNGLFS